MAAQNEQLNWEVNVDYSKMEQAAQLAQQRAQSQASMSANQIQAQYAVMQSAPNVGEMSGRGIIAQQTYNKAIYASNLTSFYNTPLVNSRPEIAANYSQPQNLLEGPAYNEHYSNSNLIKSGRRLADNSYQSALRSVGKTVGLDELGVYGAGDFSTRLVRSQQLAAERLASTKANMASKITDTAVSAAASLYTPASFFLPLSIPASLGVEAGVLAAEYSYGKYKDQRDSYKDMSYYFKDALSPNFRDRIGGGASYQRAGKFVKGMQKMAAKDEFMNKDEYSSVLEMGVGNGLFQTYDDEQKVLKGVGNIAKAIKAFNTIGAKIQESSKYIGQMANMGLSVADTPGKAAGFISTLGLTSYSANMTRDQMMTKATQAGQMMSHQNVDPAVAAQMYMQQAGAVGLLTRSGGISYKSLQKLGGQEGFADSLFQGISAAKASAFGDYTDMALMRSPELVKRIKNGSANMSDVTKAMVGMTSDQYYNLQAKKSEFSEKMDPAVLALGNTFLQFKNFAEKKGGKVEEGAAKAFFMTGMGMDSASASANIKMIQGSGKALANLQTEQYTQAAGVFMEANRKAAKPYNNWGNWFQNNVEDKFFGGLGVRAAAGIVDHEGEIYDKKMRELMPDSVSVRKSSLSVSGIIDRAGSMKDSERYSVERQIGEADRREMQKKIQGGVFFGEGNDIAKNIYKKHSQAFDNQVKTIEDLMMDGNKTNDKIGTKADYKTVLEKYKFDRILSVDEMDLLKEGIKNQAVDSNDIGYGRKTFSESALNGAIKEGKDTKDIKGHMLFGLKDEGGSKEFDAAVNAVMNQDLSVRNTKRDKVAEFMKNSDVGGLGVFLAKETTGKDFPTLKDLETLSPAEQEKIGITGQAYAAMFKGKDKPVADKFIKNLDKSGLTGVDKVEEIKKLQKAAEDSQKNLEGVIGKATGGDMKGMIATNDQLAVAQGAFKEQVIEKLINKSNFSEDDFSDASIVLGDEKVKELRKKTGGEDLIKKALEEAKKTVKSDISGRLKDNQGLQNVYTTSSAKFGDMTETMFTDNGLFGRTTDILDKSFKNMNTAINKEGLALEMMDESGINSLNDIIGGEEDTELKGELTGILAKIKQKKATPEELFEKLKDSKDSKLQAFGTAGNKLLNLKGTKLSGEELEKEKLSITQLYKEDGQVGANKLINDYMGGKLSPNAAAQAFTRSYKASTSGSNMGVIGVDSEYITGTMIDSKTKDDMKAPYQTQENILNLYKLMSAFMTNIKEKDAMTDKEKSDVYGIKVVEEKIETPIKALAVNVKDLADAIRYPKTPLTP